MCNHGTHHTSTRGTPMVHRQLLGTVLLIVGLSMLASACERELAYPSARTRYLLSEVAIALDAFVQDHADFAEALPRVEDGIELNCYLSGRLLGRYLRVESLRRQGHLVQRPHGPVLLDAWGRPLIVQCPEVFPRGLLYDTFDGEACIRPLPPSTWGPRRVQRIQVWSVGPNGVDDRGGGDDILPPGPAPARG